MKHVLISRKLFSLALLTVSMCFFALHAQAADTVLYLTSTASTTWTVPNDWNSASNTIECIGAGGNGAQNTTIHDPGAGGGGGAYAEITGQTLTGGSAVNIQVAGGGSSTSTFLEDNGNSMVLGCGAGGNGVNFISGASGTVLVGTGFAGGPGGVVATSTGRPGSGGGSAAGRFGVGRLGGPGGTATNNGGGGGAGSDNGSVGVTGGGNGGAGGNGHGGTGGGTGGTNATGTVGTAGTGGGGGGGDGGSASIDAFGGGNGAIDQIFGSLFGSGSGGGGGGGANNASHNGGIGGNGGTYGGGGGGGGSSGTSEPANAVGGAGGQGLIVVTYTPLPLPTVPGTPTYTSVAQTTLTVNWTAATGADYYKIERSTDGVSFSQIATTTSLSYGDSSLTASTTYYYWVRATNVVGDGPYSASSSVSTLSNPVTPPPSSGFIIQDAVLGNFGGYSSSTDFQIISGGTPFINSDATSSHFGSNTGPVNFSDYSPMSQTWRWYGDPNDETPTSSLAAENTAPSSVGAGQIIKLRLNIKETSGVMGSDNLKFQLQFAQSSDFTDSSGFVAEAGSCTATSTWCYATSTGGNDNQIISTKVLSTSDSCSGGVGTGCGTHNTSGVSTATSTQAAGATTEYEFTLVSDGASAGNTYFFRPINTADGSVIPLGATSSYPSLLTQGATLSFTVSGLTQGISTNGVVTNVSTTATGIPFGALALATSTIAAQRLTITTNASNGYEIYTEQDQPLTDTTGDKVPGVLGTNASPLSWATGCASTSTGCYGYHAGSPVLAGGSVRFAAADSYAALTSTIAEVGYSGTPTTSSTMDMVYRIQIAGTQITGAYQNNLMYIIAPSY